MNFWKWLFHIPEKPKSYLSSLNPGPARTLPITFKFDDNFPNSWKKIFLYDVLPFWENVLGNTISIRPATSGEIVSLLFQWHPNPKIVANAWAVTTIDNPGLDPVSAIQIWTDAPYGKALEIFHHEFMHFLLHTKNHCSNKNSIFYAAPNTDTPTKDDIETVKERYSNPKTNKYTGVDLLKFV